MDIIQYIKPGLNIARLVFTIVFFSYLGYTDIKTREFEPRKIWYPAIIAGFLFILIDVVYYAHISISIGAFRALFLTNLYIITLNVIIASVIGLGLYYIPKKIHPKWTLFGKADMKAFLVLGILLPKYTVIGPFPVANPSSFLIRPIISAIEWTALAGLFSIISITLILLFRQKSKNLTMPEAILGYQIKPEKLPEKKAVRVLHNKDGNITFDGIRGSFISEYLNWKNNEKPNKEQKFKNLEENVNLYEFIQSNEKYEIDESLDEDKIQNEISETEKYMIKLSKKDRIWVLPELPFIAYLSIGVILTCILGDPLQLIMNLI